MPKAKAKAPPKVPGMLEQRKSTTRYLLSVLVVMICMLYVTYAPEVDHFVARWYRTIKAGIPQLDELADSVSDSLENLAESMTEAMGGRNSVTRVLHGYHFEDIVRDTPWDFRPPSLLMFSSASCRAAADALGYGPSGLPGRRYLFLGEYDMDFAEQEMWHEYEEDMKLFERFNIQSCPQMVLVSRDYALENRTADFEVWDGVGSWKTWFAKAFSKFANTGGVSSEWTDARMLARDRVETSTHHSISVVPNQLPHFTEHGWMKRKMPDGLHDRMIKFYRKHEHQRSVEEWGKIGTQTNFHEHPMTLVYLDLDPYERDRIADTFVKPIVEEWSGVKNMKLNAFYGIREYYRGAELRTHVDRTETHVISVILNVGQEEIDEPWLLEVIDFNGTRLQLDMEPGDMVLYESAALPHGRPLPFKGGKYINAFCHYAPRDWDWSIKQGKAVQTGKVSDRKDNLPVLNRPSCPTETKLMSQTAGAQATVTFRNAAGEVLDVNWVDSSGVEHAAGTLSLSNDLVLQTFIGHAFRVRFADKILAQEVVIQKSGSDIGIGNCPHTQEKHTEL